VRLVAESFAWPFRGEWRSRWLLGMLLVLLLPIGFIPLLGYAIAATRSAERDPTSGPPPWALWPGLLMDGFWTSLAILATLLPFALLLNPLSALMYRAGVWGASDASLAQIHAHVLTFFILALPWGLLVLLVMPHATARFAAGGRPAELFDYAASARGVARDFATWNIAAAAMVTAWAIGLACAAALCVGVVPGVFYAILVSAHACAALHREGSPLPAR
jgi:hypothetical protein